MDLGSNAYIVASHLVMILILLALGVRAMRHLPSELRSAIAIACAALGIERAYYVIARFLRGTGIDLWGMHPAPEVLSLVVGIGLYGIMVPIVLGSVQSAAMAWRHIVVEVAFIMGFWLLLAMALY